MSILCRRLHRGHPPTCTLWAPHHQHPSMAGLALSLLLSLSLPISPALSLLSLPSSFHLYSLHDDTPAMLSWQQSGPDCSVARQLTSPIRGTWRYKARDKQIRREKKNMCTCASLCWVSLHLNSHSVISSRCVSCILRTKATHVGSKVCH